MATLKNTTVSDTGFLQLPVGTTAQRPTPAAGQMRFNSTTGKAEFYNGSVGDWIGTAGAGVVATGGTVYDTDVEGTTYRVHVFTNTGNSTFTVTQGGEVEYLIVAGGGAGGTAGSSIGAGGGGAGGLLQGTKTLSSQLYSITVGAGGASVNGGDVVGNKGANSSALGETAISGGGGGGNSAEDFSKQDGGSGGGGKESDGAGGSGTAGQGNDGGDGSESGNYAGGGGGAGAAGNQFNPGIGLASTITGTSIFYAGGGAANEPGSIITPGALGGGGSSGGNGDGGSGISNTGGGGGGSKSNTNSGAGGSGIVIIRYPLRQENPVVAAGRVVGNGLVLDLDFAKPTVYSGSGSIVNDSRLSRQGNIVGSLSYNNPKTNRAFFDFSGSSNIITFDNFTDYTDKITVEIVSLIKSTGAYQRIVTKHTDTTSATTGQSCFQLQNTNTGNFRWSVYTSGTSRDLNSGIAPTLNQIYHFVGTYDGSQLKIYVDGEEIASASASGNIRQSSQPLVIGGERTSNGSIPYEYGGDLFIARVYNTSLSAEQIQQNFNFFRWRFGI